MGSTHSFKMSPFAARAHARALARDKRAQSVPPRVSVPGPGPVEPEDSWTVVNHRRASRTPSTVAFKPKGYDKTVRGMTNQEKIAAQAGRTRLCRHFLLGECPHGDKCTYTHDISVMKPNEQKVFIGGIPSACTSRQLIDAVAKLGYKVINIPKCHPSGFAPKVCLESVEKAKELLKIARIEVEGHTADVRKYNDSRAHDSDNFAVVVSGLPEGTSGLELLQGLEKVGFLIERSPVVDAGSTVCERCEMATVEQADAVLAVESIACLGSTLTFSEFKPYSPKGATEKPRTRRGTVSSPNKSDSPRNGHNPFGSNHSRTPRSPFSTFGGSRRGTFGSFMNRALKADASMEG